MYRLWSSAATRRTATETKRSFFGAAGFRTFAALLDEWAASDPGQLDYFGGHSLVTLSHGQSLMAFFRSPICMTSVPYLYVPE